MIKSLLALAILSPCVLAQDAPTVKVLNGTLQGSKCPSTNANYFFSIPFAKPPVGDLRFAAPQPYDSTYNGTLDATKPPASCPQFETVFVEYGPQAEDW